MMDELTGATSFAETSDFEAFADPEWLGAAAAPPTEESLGPLASPEWLNEATPTADLTTMDTAIREGAVDAFGDPDWLAETAPLSADEPIVEPIGEPIGVEEPHWLASPEIAGEDPAWLADDAATTAEAPPSIAVPPPAPPSPAKLSGSAAQAEASLEALLGEIAANMAQKRHADQIAATRTGASAQAGQYVVFYLGPTRFALPIDAVIEVSTTPRITHLPGIPHYVRGVANLRGEILPVLDMRSLLGLPRQGSTVLERMLVLRSAEHDVVAGFIVDRIRGLIRLDAATVQQPQGALEDPVMRFIAGIAENEQQVLNVLNPRRIFLSEEVRRLSQQ